LVLEIFFFFYILAIPEMSVNSDTLCIHNQNNAMVWQIILAAHSLQKHQV